MKKEISNRELIEKAKQAMAYAYSPYSKFKVGAALLASSGQIFLGCNIENASYGASNCAERTAIFKAISEGVDDFEKIAIVSSSKDTTYPCGICRQVLAEHMPKGSFIFESKEGNILEYSMDQLLPFAFSEKDLNK